ncbi:MAG: Gldg family protein [Caulobacterales bacterium]
MTARRFAVIAGLLFLIIFVAGNLVANSWFRAWRLDLTQDKLYSLSAGTRDILSPRELTEPIQITFYFSRDAAARAPDIAAYGERVREMLQAYQSAARGRLRFVEVDPKRFSEEEDAAAAAGIEPVRLQGGGDPIYFGLAGANAIDDKRVIPFFDLAREQFLEYEITRLIYELENPEPAKIALISSLPFDPENAALMMQMGQRPSIFASELGRFMRVEKIAPDFTEIPSDANAIAIIHPGPLTPAQFYAIDQFILRTGRAFIALDPASMTSAQMAGDPTNPVAYAPASSNLAPLFTAWGVTMTTDIVLDREGALEVQAQDPQGQTVRVPQPLFFAVAPDRLAKDDLMTAPLRRGLNFGMAGALTWSERGGRTFERLALTTGDTMRIPAEVALQRPSPYDLVAAWRPGGRIETIALRMSGVLDSAFPNGPPQDAPPLAEGVQRLTSSAQSADIVIVSDADFLADDFYVDERGGTFADNGAFAVNAIDILAGSQALVSLRARAPSLRPMTLVANMEREAQARIQERQDQLQSELQETEARLEQLRQGGRGSGFFAGEAGAQLTTEESAEIDRFTARVGEVRAELRRVGRELRADIDNLKALVVFINMWLAPLLVAGVGLYLFWRRQRRARRRS